MHSENSSRLINDLQYVAGSLPDIHVAFQRQYENETEILSPSGMHTLIAFFNGTGKASFKGEQYEFNKSTLFMLKEGEKIAIKPACRSCIGCISFSFSGIKGIPEAPPAFHKDIAELPVFNVTAFVHIFEPMKKVIKEFQEDNHNKKMACGLYLTLSLLHLNRNLIFEGIKIEAPITKNYLQEFKMVKAVRLYLRQHFSENIDHEKMFAGYPWHINTCRSIFKKHTGIPVSKYQLNTRMVEASRLLIETSMPIIKIAEKVGFDDYYYFLKRFKKVMDKTPSEVRNNSKLEAVIKKLHFQ